MRGRVLIASLPEMNNSTGMSEMHMDQKMMTHLTFLWGKSTEIIFAGWPGQSFNMYVSSLIFVFALSFLVEWLSHTRLIKPGMNHIAAGLIQTVMYGFRVGLAYLVMLAVMSFNVGVLLAAVAGFTAGFLLFGSRAFMKSEMTPYEKPTDLPPLNC
ncbi:hypothetical protein L1049_012893 [Liquidambar formosana]|uniref:Copper transport protein n=1 Tax=Liquidambar formosana TaxID=63359 RepID=A0AAP0RMJ5_LIQFO